MRNFRFLAIAFCILTAAIGFAQNGPTVTSLSVTPAAVTGFQNSEGTITLSAKAPKGGSAVSVTVNSTNVEVPATVTVPEGRTSYKFLIHTVGVAKQEVDTLTAKLGSSTATASITINPGVPLTLEIIPAQITSGGSVYGAVILGYAAPTGGVTVTLASASSLIDYPVSLTIPAGHLKETFKIGTQATVTNTMVSLIARWNGNRSEANVTLLPVPFVLSFGTAGRTGGNPITGTVTLTKASPTGGTTLNVTSNSKLATVASTVTVPAGATSATFDVATKPVAETTPIVITASGLDTTSKASFDIFPPRIDSLTLSPSSVKGGTTSTGTVTIPTDAPASGYVITLSSSLGSVSVPEKVTIKGGTRSATFMIKTSVGPVQKTATITAKAPYGPNATATLTITL
jgi:trimeric autotransporter adhesin